VTGAARNESEDGDMTKVLALLGLTAVLATAAQAGLRTQTVEYKQGDTVLEGYLAWDDAVQVKRPGVIVVHDWMGVGPFARGKCDDLAKLGYVALAADIYGKGIRPANAQEAGRQAGKYKGDRALLRARAVAALETLRANPMVDPRRIAAIGYCFGGTTVIELARSGAAIAAVVSFHGGLDSPAPADGKNIKAKVLALHGADDPTVSAADLAAFEDEMRKAGVDWQLIEYGGAVHAFTNPAAGSNNSKGAAYNERADRRSWAAMQIFFAEVLK
jgi:dienelactone hydrolase